MLLVGEGTTDIGHEEFYDPRRPAPPGVLDTLARALSGNIDIEFRRIRFTELARDPVSEAKELIERAAASALAAAVLHGANALLFSHDCDGSAPDELIEAAGRGFESYIVDHPEAQDIVRVLAFPRRMIESWLLAQPEAFARAFGRQRISLFRFPRNVEGLHGKKHDPEGDYPKQVFRRAVRAFGRGNNQEARVAVAAEIDLDSNLSHVPTLAAFVEATRQQVSRCAARSEGQQHYTLRYIRGRASQRRRTRHVLR